MKPNQPFDLLGQMREVVAPTGGFSIQAVENFWEFIAEGGFEVDRRRILPEPFFWLHPLYRITRTDLLGRKDASGNWIIRPKFEVGLMMRKASQMGASVFSMLFMIWLCIDPTRPLSIACFWPTEDDLQDFVRSRFKKLVESTSKMDPYIGDGRAYNTRIIELGKSIIYMRYVKGNASLDSIPVDVVIADEVRLYDDAAKILERADFRMAQSKVKLRIYFSTVGSPGDFMETRWDESNQIKFFTDCPSCEVHTEVMNSDAERDRLWSRSDIPDVVEGRILRGVVLSDHMPTQFIRRGSKFEARRGEDGVEYTAEIDDTHYICPCCQGRIDDTSIGSYRETNPGPGRWWAIEFSAVLSPDTSAKTILDKWEQSKDRKEFFNNILAKPYIDPEGILIKPKAVEENRSSAIEWERHTPRGMTATMGADFRTDEIHVVIRGSSGMNDGQILHLEVIQTRDEPMKRLEQLIIDYRITRAVIDYRPHTTYTLALAQKHDLIVYLAQYVPGDLIRLKSDNSPGTSRVDEDVREKNMVLLDRTKSLKYAAMIFSAGQSLVPSEPLYQSNFVDRRRVQHDTYDLSEEFLLHLQNLALVHKPATTKNESGETKQKAGELIEEVVNVKFDPHFFHAYSYAVMADLLSGGEASIVRGDPEKVRQRQEEAQKAEINPLQRLFGRLQDPRLGGRRCGLCVHFGGEDQPRIATRCNALGKITDAEAPICDRRLFRPKRTEEDDE